MNDLYPLREDDSVPVVALKQARIRLVTNLGSRQLAEADAARVHREAERSLIDTERTLERCRIRLQEDKESIAALEAAIERIEASEPAGPTDEGEL